MIGVILGWALFGFLILRFLVVLTNYITGNVLEDSLKENSVPMVSILIPVRNEAENLPSLLNNLLKIDYPNFEILLYDDQSTDESVSILEFYQEKDVKISFIQGEKKPEDWLGKNHACYQLAQRAKGKYFLFIDADVRLSEKVLQKALAYMDKTKLSLLSIFSSQKVSFPGTGSVVPIINWILLSMLPLRLVQQSSWTSFSAANGQFMLFEREAYKNTEPHLFCKQKKAEDIAISRYFKANKYSVSVLLGGKDVLCEMYSSEKEAIQGFTKNVFDFLGGSKVVTIFYALIIIISPVYLLIAQMYHVFIAYLLILIILKLFIAKMSAQSLFNNLLYMPVQQFRFVQIICLALYKESKKQLYWKGRPIS